MPPAARGAIAERERLISRWRRIARTQRRAVPARLRCCFGKEPSLAECCYSRRMKVIHE
jgi:hypothetical protein